jgi:hypothetical protein
MVWNIIQRKPWEACLVRLAGGSGGGGEAGGTGTVAEEVMNETTVRVRGEPPIIA